MDVLRLILLIALGAGVYVCLHLAVTLWHSWLAAGAVLAFGVALFWLIWPSDGEE